MDVVEVILEKVKKGEHITLEEHALLPNVIWKQVPLKDCGRYEVSNYGYIRSYNQKIPKILKTSRDKVRNTYAGTAVGKGQRVEIHAQVCLVFNFNDSPETKTQVDHINGIKTDNRASNLRWVTPKENMKSAVNLGLIRSGEKATRAKLDDKTFIQLMDELTKNKVSEELAKAYGLDRGYLFSLKKGKTGRAKKFFEQIENVL